MKRSFASTNSLLQPASFAARLWLFVLTAIGLSITLPSSAEAGYRVPVADFLYGVQAPASRFEPLALELLGYSPSSEASKSGLYSSSDEEPLVEYSAHEIEQIADEMGFWLPAPNVVWWWEYGEQDELSSPPLSDGITLRRPLIHATVTSRRNVDSPGSVYIDFLSYGTGDIRRGHRLVTIGDVQSTATIRYLIRGRSSEMDDVSCKETDIWPSGRRAITPLR